MSQPADLFADLVGIGHVELRLPHLVAGLGQPGRRRLDGHPGAAVHDDLGPGLGQAPCNGKAQTAGRAGDKSRAAGQVKHVGKHGVVLQFVGN